MGRALGQFAGVLTRVPICVLLLLAGNGAALRLKWIVLTGASVFRGADSAGAEKVAVCCGRAVCDPPASIETSLVFNVCRSRPSRAGFFPAISSLIQILLL